VASAISAVPLVWIFLSLWQQSDADSGPIHENNYYDLQARAMLHGHLWLANGSLGIEAFVHDGRQYTYFGLFPSLARMPVLIFTSAFDSKLTPSYMFIAWLATGVFASLLIWRVRVLVRGPASMGWAETISYGVMMATVMGGTVFMLLASDPDTFQEDLAWSICLTTGSLFALIGVLERPSWRRVILSIGLIAAGNLDRATTGWVCAGAAILIGIWFGIGRAGRENRRWCLPVMSAGVIPLAVGCAVNYSKFGVPFGVSNFDQIYTHVNAYRRKFLAANHNSEYGIAFIPSTLLAYLRPDGLRFTDVFPFITLPAVPPAALGGVLFDRRYRTASLPASMPYLFLLSCWGVVTAFRRKPIGRVALTRIPLLASALAGGALFIWGYIAPRYLADFVPFLILASAVAMADIWRRLASRDRSVRSAVLTGLTLVALFTVAANIAMAITPNEVWDTRQVVRYVETQKTISDLTGHPLNSNVVRGNSLPPWGPADQLFVVGNCDGMYISNGEYYSTVPLQQYQRTTWMVVERGHQFQHTYRVTFNRPTQHDSSLRLVTAGPRSIWITVEPTSNPHRVNAYLSLLGGAHPVFGLPASVAVGSSENVVVITDPAKHLVQGSVKGVTILSDATNLSDPISDAGSSRAEGNPPAIVVQDRTASSPEPTLCQSLIGSKS
jgi:hypothetical protein